MGSKMYFPLFCVFLFVASVLSVAEAEECKTDKVVFCYFASWATYRHKFGKYNVEDIDPSLCTHAVYGFAGLNIDGQIFSLDPANDLPERGGLQQYYYFVHLREKNPCLKTLLSIGGWNEGSEKYSIMAETPETRARFIDHLLRFIVYYGFDGIDIDWEYPAQRGGIAIDRQNHVKLLKELKARLEPRGKMVCIAVGASTNLPTVSYDVKAVSEIVDYVLLMSYDYQRIDVTSHMAPLNKVDGDNNSGCVADSVKLWLDNGCPKEKLVLGVVTSGRSFVLKNPSEDPKENGLGLEIIGTPQGGPYTNVSGFLSYYEVCFILSEDEGWFVVSDDEVYGASYATKDDLWITYEDEATILKKSAYALSQNLAGVMVYSMDTDDFRGLCGLETYPLLKAVKAGLGMA